MLAAQHTEPRLRFQGRLTEPVAMATEPTADERPLRADARRNRERILDAARCACAQHGTSVQMDDVARGAGVGVGTVYRHFPTKDALIEALVAEKYRTVVEQARAALEVEDPWDSFAGLLTSGAELMARDAALRDAFTRLGPDLPYAAAARAEFEDLAGRVLTRAQEARVLRPDV